MLRGNEVEAKNLTPNPFPQGKGTIAGTAARATGSDLSVELPRMRGHSG